MSPEKAGGQGKGRPLRLPPEVFAALDRDAARCRRSANKQVEAILTVYYGLDYVELADVGTVRNIVSPHLAQPEREGGEVVSEPPMSFQVSQTVQKDRLPPHQVTPRRSNTRSATQKEVASEVDRLKNKKNKK